MTARPRTSFGPAAAQHLRTSSGVVGSDVSLPQQLAAIGWIPPHSAESDSATQHMGISALSDAPSVWPAEALRSQVASYESSNLPTPKIAGPPLTLHQVKPS